MYTSNKTEMRLNKDTIDNLKREYRRDYPELSEHFPKFDLFVSNFEWQVEDGPLLGAYGRYNPSDTTTYSGVYGYVLGRIQFFIQIGCVGEI